MKKNVYSYRFIFPAILLYGIFFVLPGIVGVFYSFTDWTIGKDAVSFVGLKNYVGVFASEELRKAIVNTFLYAVIVVVFKNLNGLLLALAANAKLKLRNFIRAVFFLPCIVSTIVIGLVFVPILHPNGFLNSALSAVGLGALQQKWLVDPKIVMLTIAGVSIWQWSGYHMVIYLAGLQGISQTYYEAAEIDGANSWNKFSKITFPLMASSLNINVILSLIGGLKVFSEPYALTNGGPGNASQVIALEVFKKFGQGQWGLGTALNVLQLLFVAIICIPLLSRMRRREVDEQ